MKSEIILILGTFNPPTVAHIQMSVELHKLYPDVEVCYVPSSYKYTKIWKHGLKLLDCETRAKLILGAFHHDPKIDHENVTVSTYESSVWSDGNTITTADYFRGVGNTVTLCLGSDNLVSLPGWTRGIELVQKYNFIVLTRGSDELPAEFKPYAGHFKFVPFNYPSVSSTKIREAYARGELDSVKNDLPDNVYQFLKEHKGLF